MKKSLIIITILVAIGLMAACSLPFSSSTQSTTRTTQNAFITDPSKLPVESKLAIGILKLEGTELSVDSTKAKDLLPLFSALKMLSTNNNTAVEEISALNKQIMTTMKSDQIAAIEKITLTSADLKTLMSEHGLSGTGSTGNGSSNSNSSRTSGNDFGPGGPGGGGIPGISGGGAQTSSSRVQATPNAAQAAQSARKTAGGLNLTFADPVIKLLESKITQ